MENFSELIKSRRSMRKFTEEELSQEEVVVLLKKQLFGVKEVIPRQIGNITTFIICSKF